MSRPRLRQIERLEKRAQPYIAQRQLDEEKAREKFRLHRDHAFVRVANLALLILYGEPKIGEPLTCAWQRCFESDALKAYCESHPETDQANPFDERGVWSIAQYFREKVQPDLPGIDARAKLNAVMATAPAWLLWFTCVEFDLLYLGLEVPDLSSMCRYARPLHIGKGLPEEAYELCRLPDGIDDKVLSELIKLDRKRSVPEQKPTPRARMRALRRKESVDKPSSVVPAGGDAVAEFLRSMSEMSGVAFGKAYATRYQLPAAIDEVDFDHCSDNCHASQPRMARAYQTRSLGRVQY
jgi:hypothetical protein